MDVPEDLLRESVEELFEHGPCGYVSTAAGGAVVLVNGTFCAWTGHDREALLAGARFQDLLTVPGKIYYETHVDPLLRMQGFVREVALDLLRPGRDPLPVLVNVAQKRDAAGRQVLNRISVFDATDRRQYERELLLTRRRAEQAAEAERAARELAERATRTKDEFLAVISHELRTPLNAILGWTQILRGADAELTDDVREGLEVIERNARVQGQLVEDLLDMGRVLSGKLRLDVQPVNLADVVDAAVATARPAVDAKGIRLRKVLDPSVVVSGDPGRLQQVFWNLLSNAAKFTPRGGSVRVVMGRVNSHVEVSVTDTGPGMTPEFVAHAFERFRQSDTPATRQTGGLGLGLSIVRSLAEMHGGAVEAHSEGAGRGSTFVVRLPLAVVHSERDGDDRVHPRAAVADASRPGRLDVSLAGVRVMVVDNEPDARDVVRRVLAAAGAEVVTAASVAEALGALERARPDVLLSDIGMPGEDGYEFIRRVRMLGDGVGGVQAVALTAFARPEDRTQAMLAGYQMHLAKPVDPRELVATVASLAGRLTT